MFHFFYVLCLNFLQEVPEGYTTFYVEKILELREAQIRLNKAKEKNTEAKWVKLSSEQGK